ncbi:MAG: hypothetical protein R3E84_23330 [Pseudomonadales bacterium]
MLKQSLYCAVSLLIHLTLPSIAQADTGGALVSHVTSTAPAVGVSLFAAAAASAKTNAAATTKNRKVRKATGAKPGKLNPKQKEAFRRRLREIREDFSKERSSLRDARKQVRAQGEAMNKAISAEKTSRTALDRMQNDYRQASSPGSGASPERIKALKDQYDAALAAHTSGPQADAEFERTMFQITETAYAGTRDDYRAKKAAAVARLKDGRLFTMEENRKRAEARKAEKASLFGVRPKGLGVTLPNGTVLINNDGSIPNLPGLSDRVALYARGLNAGSGSQAGANAYSAPPLMSAGYMIPPPPPPRVSEYMLPPPPLPGTPAPAVLVSLREPPNRPAPPVPQRTPPDRPAPPPPPAN